MAPRSRAAELIAALIIFLTAGYFQNTRPGWNVNSQFALTVAIAERGTLRIDAYHEHPDLATGDKVYFDDHFYSDKSPVTAFLGVPAFWLYETGARAIGADIDYNAARYWTTWLTIGLSAAILAWLTSIFLIHHGAPPARASLAGALWIVATPLIGYSILFFNYVPSCAMALGGFMAAESFRRSGSRPMLLLGGILLGLASWTLSTFALLAVLITIALVIDAIRQGGRAVAALWPWAAGGIIGASGYAIYSLVIFGEVTNPYRYEFDENFREQMSRGLMGAGLPDLHVLWMITFHPFRGLFTLFPITLAATGGAVALLFRRGERAVPAIALAFLAGMLLYNSGYFMWWGGWAYAPRHLIPALALLPIGLAPLLRAQARWPYGLVLALAIASAAFHLPIVALDPQPPPGLTEQELYDPASIERWPAPHFEMLRFVARGQTDPNWGTRLGLRGFASLVPLVLIWIAGGILIAVTASRGTPPQPSPRPSPREAPAAPGSPPENPPA